MTESEFSTPGRVFWGFKLVEDSESLDRGVGVESVARGRAIWEFGSSTEK